MGVLHFLLALLILAFMIFIHELGHYTAGRLLGFTILDFSIGFGPALFKFKKKDITYALRAIPLGGACRFYGEDEEPEVMEKVAKDAVPFNSQKPIKRLIVIFAGPLMNILLAFLLAFVMMLCFGERRTVMYDTGDYAITINEVVKDGAAEKSGIMEGDVILAVNGIDISGEPHEFGKKADIISKCIDEAPAEGLTITVLRDNERREVFVSDIYNAAQGKNVIGITMGYTEYFVPYGFFRSFAEAGKFLVDIVKTTFSALANGFKNGFHEGDFSGVFGTVAITMKMASLGVYYVILITVLISMSLGIMNLLPVLPLDGGHLLFDFIELIFGKPVPRKIQNTLSMIGIVLLLALMVYATFGDIKGIFNGLYS